MSSLILLIKKGLGMQCCGVKRFIVVVKINWKDFFSITKPTLFVFMLFISLWQDN